MKTKAINTCEEYVVSELIEAKDTIEKQADTIKTLTARINELESGVLDFLKVLSPEFRKTATNEAYISFESVWEQYSSDRYPDVVAFLSRFGFVNHDESNEG